MAIAIKITNTKYEIDFWSIDFADQILKYVHIL